MRVAAGDQGVQRGVFGRPGKGALDEVDRPDPAGGQRCELARNGVECIDRPHSMTLGTRK